MTYDRQLKFCLAKRNFKSSRMQLLVEKSMKNGYKACVYERNGVYRGEWKNDMKHGYGRMVYKNQEMYEGQWEFNKRNGYGRIYKNVGRNQIELLLEGSWIDNQFFRGKCKVKNGTYNGNFAYSKTGTRMKCGFGTMWWKDGTLYEGEWLNDEYHGKGLFTEVNGNYYEGEWCNGMKHGEGVYVFKDKGRCMDGVWVRGIPKVSTIGYLNEQVAATDLVTKQRKLIPEPLKNDEDYIWNEYNEAKAEMLKNLNILINVHFKKDTSSVSSTAFKRTVCF